MSEQKPIPFYKNPEFWRPQTWLLLLALVVQALLPLLPLAVYDLGGGQGRFSVHMQTLSNAPQSMPAPGNAIHWMLPVATGLGLLLILLVLANYRRRMLQLRFLRLLIAVSLFAGAGLLWQVMALEKAFAVASNYTGISYQVGLLVPIVVAVLAITAIRGVRKDEKRLKNMDRFW